MRHRHGLLQTQPYQQPSPGDAAQHDRFPAPHEAIKTTVPKAKELRRVVEPIITLGKALDPRQQASGFRPPARP